jgi:2-aminoadipate transaminase
MSQILDVNMEIAGNRCRLSQRAGRTCDQPISFLMQQAVANPDMISLAAGLADQSCLPVEVFRNTLRPLLDDSDRARIALQYGTTQGDMRLRRLLVKHLEHLEGIPACEMALEAERMVVTTGSQQALQLVGDALIDPGDIVLVGAPDYFVYLGTLETLGAEIVGVAMDEEGMLVDALEDTFSELQRKGDLPRVKMVYCDSYYQNPTGVTLHESRRPAILDTVKRWSREGKIYLLEDAAYRELCYEGSCPRSIRSYDDDSTVILAQSFSKSLSPGLKLGYVVLPPELVDPVVGLKGNHDFGSSNLSQQILAQMLESGAVVEHAAELRQAYQRKQMAMLNALGENMPNLPIPSRWVRPTGGLYVWLCFPEGIDTTRSGPLYRECLNQGVLYVPGEFCFPPEGNQWVDHPLGCAQNTLRLTFGALPEDRVEQGVQRLAAAVRGCCT